MKATAVVEAGVLEDQTTEVTVGSHDVVGLFFLAELVTRVLTFSFGSFPDYGGGYEGTPITPYFHKGWTISSTYLHQVVGHLFLLLRGLNPSGSL